MDVCFDAVVMLLVHNTESRINFPWLSAFSISTSFINKSVIIQTLVVNFFFLWAYIVCWKTFSGRMLITLDLTRATSLSYSYSHPEPLLHTSSLTHPHTTTHTHTHIPRVLTTQRTNLMWETMLRGCGHQILNKRFRKHSPFILPVVVEKSYFQTKGRCTVSWLNWS